MIHKLNCWKSLVFKISVLLSAKVSIIAEKSLIFAGKDVVLPARLLLFCCRQIAFCCRQCWLLPISSAFLLPAKESVAGCLKFMLPFIAGNRQRQGNLNFPCCCLFLAVALPNPGSERLFLTLFVTFSYFSARIDFREKNNFSVSGKLLVPLKIQEFWSLWFGPAGSWLYEQLIAILPIWVFQTAAR